MGLLNGLLLLWIISASARPSMYSRRTGFKCSGCRYGGVHAILLGSLSSMCWASAFTLPTSRLCFENMLWNSSISLLYIGLIPSGTFDKSSLFKSALEALSARRARLENSDLFFCGTRLINSDFSSDSTAATCGARQFNSDSLANNSQISALSITSKAERVPKSWPLSITISKSEGFRTRTLVLWPPTKPSAAQSTEGSNSQPPAR